MANGFLYPRNFTVELMEADDATSAWVKVQGAGYYNWMMWGTWDGAAAQLQWSPDGGTTGINLDGVTLTADGGWTDIPLAQGHVRIVITGAGTTSLSSSIYGIQ